jgi:electron transfer flavoprotein beta subunit
LGPLNVVVCVKQVPETTDVKIDPTTKTLVREGVPSIINPFDTYAVEEAIRIRERIGGKVTVISMGPPQAQEALKDCIAVGADEAVLLSDRALAGADTLATAYTLARAITRTGADLVLCGKQATDGDTAQVGPGIAEELDIPHVTYVRKITLEDKKAVVERLVEGGYEVVEVSLPALFTVVKEINVPRLPSLRGKIKAKNTKIPVWSATDLDADQSRIGLVGSPTEVIRVFSPEMRQKGEMLTAPPPEAARELLARLEAVIR